MEPDWVVVAGQGPDAASAVSDGYWSAGPASAAVAAVSVALDELLSVDLGLPGTGELLDVLRGVERECRRLTGVSVAIIGQIERRGLGAPAGAVCWSLVSVLTNYSKHPRLDFCSAPPPDERLTPARRPG